MKFILIKAGEKARVVELEGVDNIDYKTMKKYLEIDSPVTVVERKIGENYYDLWVDDEGLFKEERIVTGFLRGSNTQEFLVGNMLIMRHDLEGNSIGLNEDDIQSILNPISMISVSDFSLYSFGENKKDIVIKYDFDGGFVKVKKDSNFLVYKL